MSLEAIAFQHYRDQTIRRFLNLDPQLRSLPILPVRVNKENAPAASKSTEGQPGVIGMKMHTNSRTVSPGAWLCLLALGLLGCATPDVPSGVAPDRSSIEGLRGIGSFTWRGSAEVAGGASGFGGNLIGALTAQSEGREREAIQSSALYETFAREFTQEFSTVSTVPVRQLDESKYVLAGKEKERRVDVAASATAEGFDAVLESTVWPTLKKAAFSSGVMQLTIHYKLQRLSDFKVLWQDSLTIHAENQHWNELARTAAKLAVERYGRSSK